MPVPLGSVRVPQPDFSATALQHADHASGVDIGLGRVRRIAGFLTRGSESRSRRNCTGSFPAAWASSSMKDWKTKEKALVRGARIAQVGTPSGNQRGLKIEKFVMNVPGNSFEGMFAELSELLALAEADEVIAPGDEFAGGVDAALQVVETAGTVVSRVEIVFAGPEQLDGHADDLGDPGDFEHVVVGEAPAEAAAGAHQVNGDVVLGDAQQLGDVLAAGFGCLAGGPDFELAVLDSGRCSSAAPAERGR